MCANTAFICDLCADVQFLEISGCPGALIPPKSWRTTSFQTCGHPCIYVFHQVLNWRTTWNWYMVVHRTPFSFFLSLTRLTSLHRVRWITYMGIKYCHQKDLTSFHAILSLLCLLVVSGCPEGLAESSRLWNTVHWRNIPHGCIWVRHYHLIILFVKWNMCWRAKVMDIMKAKTYSTHTHNILKRFALSFMRTNVYHKIKKHPIRKTFSQKVDYFDACSKVANAGASSDVEFKVNSRV